MLADSIPYWPVNPVLSISPWFTFQIDLVRTFWAVLPATLMWGASFPLALAAVAAPGEDPGRLAGETYAANTVGAILGALAFSIVIIPLAGTRNAERILMTVSAIAAMMALAYVGKAFAGYLLVGCCRDRAPGPVRSMTFRGCRWRTAAAASPPPMPDSRCTSAKE